MVNHISTLKTDTNNLTQYTYYHTDGKLIFLFSYAFKLGTS